MYKHAALSPAIQALQQTPTPEAQTQAFEKLVSDSAYKTFGTKFPDLVEHVVTFRMLASDAEKGTAFGAFILDVAGKPAYVPVVMNDSELEPLDILYLKDTDTFVPFSREWIEEITRDSQQALGEGQKLPESVPTDVDIRNLVVPPTTGRYSYASAEMKLAAEGSYPLGQRLAKTAAETFDPELWTGFVSNFGQHNGVTPGVALDQGQMDIDTLSKMYKSYVKTWQMPQEAQEQAAAAQAQAMPQQAPQGAPQQPMPQQAAPQGAPQDPSQPKMAAAVPQTNIGQMLGRAGDTMAHYGERAVLGGAVGSALGGLSSAYDDNYTDVGGRMLTGGFGGALGAVAGTALGNAVERRALMAHPHSQLANNIGELGFGAGMLAGGLGAALPDRTTAPVDYGSAMVDPSMAPGMYRFASAEDLERGVVSMLKHAKADPAPRQRRLLPYLNTAPNGVKTAFAQVLKREPAVLKLAAETYGVEPLLEALRPRAEKTAGMVNDALPESVKVIDSRKGTKAFGQRSPLAFRGVQLRGYYFEDSRPAKNLATIEQEYHDVHDARESGVYMLWRADGSQQPALVIPAPIDLLDEGRPTYPNGTEGISRTSRYAPATHTMHAEPNARESISTARTSPDVERSHKLERLVVFGNGKYRIEPQVHGEQVTEVALKGTRLWNTLFSDAKAAPRAGRGMFAYKRGAHYYATKPVVLSNVTTKDGVITGGMSEWSEYSQKEFRIDTRSPQTRLMRPRGEKFVVIPAHWRWIPLDKEDDASDLLLTGSAVIDLALNRLGSMGAHKMVVRNVGADSVTVDGRSQMPKAAALHYIANREGVSGADAEAILKIAELEGHCKALIVPKAALAHVKEMAKSASAIEQAFSEVLQGLQGSLEQLQGQVQVLQSVQQRAQELSGQAGQAPEAMQQTDPAMQGQDPNAQAAMQAPQGQMPPQAAPQGQDPNAQAMPPQAAPQGQDPNAQAMPPQAAPQGQDPNALPQDPNAQPPLPVMPTEGPSASEMSQQINPAYLNQAASLQQGDVFDAGALAELQRATSTARGGATLREGDTKDLAETVDDLGRTLLTMQLRAVELQEQLSLDGYVNLENQVRNSFKGLGELLLEMKQHTTMLNDAQAAQ